MACATRSITRLTLGAGGTGGCERSGIRVVAIGTSEREHGNVDDGRGTIDRITRYQRSRIAQRLPPRASRGSAGRGSCGARGLRRRAPTSTPHVGGSAAAPTSAAAAATPSRRGRRSSRRRLPAAPRRGTRRPRDRGGSTAAPRNERAGLGAAPAPPRCPPMPRRGSADLHRQHGDEVKVIDFYEAVYARPAIAEPLQRAAGPPQQRLRTSARRRRVLGR